LFLVLLALIFEAIVEINSNFFLFSIFGIMIYPDLTKDRRGYLAWSLEFSAVTFNPQSIAASNNSEKVGSKTA